MPLKEHVYSVLVVSAAEKFNKSIAALLSGKVYEPVHYAGSVNAAQRATLERLYDIIIINTPLPDDFGVKFATEITLNGSSVVMLFARGDVYPSVYEKVCDYGVFAVRKPVQPITVAQALDWLKATRERLRGMEKRVVSIRDKMEEIKIVNRAKWALINSCNMTEADAHRYIEKQAMDRCVTRREIAETIIKTYK